MKNPKKTQNDYRKEFATLIEYYRHSIGSNCHKGGTRNKESYIVKIQKMPRWVRYYFFDYPNEPSISVELDVNVTKVPWYESTIRGLKNKKFKNLSAKNSLRSQPTKDGKWLKLQFCYSEDAPDAIIEGMKNLIEQTYPDIVQQWDKQESTIIKS